MIYEVTFFSVMNLIRNLIEVDATYLERFQKKTIAIFFLFRRDFADFQLFLTVQQ